MMESLEYRSFGREDASGLWTLMDRLDHETSFMLYQPGERKKDLSRVSALIAGAGEDGCLLGAFDGVRLVGFVSAQRGGTARIRHMAYVVTGVLSAYRRRGVGTELFVRMEGWAVQAGVERLELTVAAENAGAVALYAARGFEREGIRRKSMRVDGAYMDELYMAKLL